jgi:TolB-like protein
MALFEELKRRKVFKVGGAYLVLAWLGVQVASTVLPVFGAPVWVLRVLILVIALGFPLAVVMAWLLEATPDGLKVDKPGAGSKRVIGAALAIAALAVTWYFVGQPAVRGFDAKPASTPSVVAAVAAPKADAPPERSIAVLAFDDMSPKHDNEYLGDGIAEEILDALAKVDGLKVAGRTSSFHYKGRNEDLRVIGKELNVATVLEGSVRRQGDQVRITAQLVRTSDGYHLWSDQFPGTMDDVFALQDRIAHSVAEQLQVVLKGDQSKQLVDVGTRNADAYALYLQASLIFNRRQGARFPEGMDLLRQAIRLDPKYARAWARLASMNAISGNYRSVDPAVLLASTTEAAKHAEELDPQLGEPWAATGLAMIQLRRFKDGRAALAKALELEPGDITATVWNGITLNQYGYRAEGDKLLDRALEMDPVLPIALLWRGMSHAAQGEIDLADRQLKLADESNLAFGGLGQAQLAQMRHEKNEVAAQQIARAFAVLAAEFPTDTQLLMARTCSGDASARAETLARIDSYLAGNPKPVAASAIYTLFCAGQTDRAIELYGRAPSSNDALVNGAIFRGLWPDVLASPKFPALARQVGWAELWDDHGPPDMCRKAPNGDWLCTPKLF